MLLSSSASPLYGNDSWDFTGVPSRPERSVNILILYLESFTAANSLVGVFFRVLYNSGLL